MTAERYIKAIIYLTVLTWAIILYLNHETLKAEWLQYLSLATLVVITVIIAFDLWLWKLPFLHSWFVKRPVIDGTWKVQIRSNWTDPATGSPRAPTDGYMVIRQTFSRLSLRLLTEESSSELLGTEIVCSVDGLYCVSGVFRNEPRFEMRQQSPIHYGAVWLKIIEETSQKLIGHYWTDRGTAGEMELTNRHSETFQTFQSAHAHYTPTPHAH